MRASSLLIELKEFYLLLLVGGVCEVVHSPHQQEIFFSPGLGSGFSFVVLSCIQASIEQLMEMVRPTRMIVQMELTLQVEQPVGQPVERQLSILIH